MGSGRLRAGQEGRAIVRGGLLPLASMEELIQIRLSNRQIPVAERAEYVAVMLRSYFETHPEQDETAVFWHRLLGDSIIQVGVS